MSIAMQRLAPTLSKLKSKKEGSLTKTVPDPYLYLGLIKLSADFTTVLNRKILWSTGSMLPGKQSSSWLHRVHCGKYNVDSISMQAFSLILSVVKVTFLV